MAPPNERRPDPAAPPARKRTWQVTAAPAEVSELRRSATGWLQEQGVDAATLADVRLALAEGLSNAALHAFADEAPGEVSLTLQLDLEMRSLVVGIRDHGAGMRARADSPGLGLGLSLMSRVAGDVDIASAADGEGTAVVLTFVLQPPPR